MDCIARITVAANTNRVSAIPDSGQVKWRKDVKEVRELNLIERDTGEYIHSSFFKYYDFVMSNLSKAILIKSDLTTKYVDDFTRPKHLNLPF